jgi:hypothetical protein
VSVVVLPAADDADVGADSFITKPLQLEDVAPAGASC